jgi:hypothetical protein
LVLTQTIKGNKNKKKSWLPKEPLIDLGSGDDVDEIKDNGWYEPTRLIRSV